jgi:transcriptional regulator GlxA family with amidase domain
MLLARAGLIGTRPATTHHAVLTELAATGATALTDRVVDDGDLVTCGGVTSGIDLALWLVEREFGCGLADEVADAMAYPRTRPTTAD